MDADLPKKFEKFQILVDKGSLEECLSFLKDNRSLKSESLGDFSALHLARDNFDLLELLLKNGVSANVSDSVGSTLLMDASGVNDTSMIELLLSYGANVNQLNHSGESPLSVAVANGNLEAAKILSDNGADMKIKVGGVTLAHWALLSGSDEVVRWLGAKE